MHGAGEENHVLLNKRGKTREIIASLMSPSWISNKETKNILSLNPVKSVEVNPVKSVELN